MILEEALASRVTVAIGRSDRKTTLVILCHYKTIANFFLRFCLCHRRTTVKRPQATLSLKKKKKSKLFFVFKTVDLESRARNKRCKLQKHEKIL